MIKCTICNKHYQEGRLFKDHMNKTHQKNENGSSNERHSTKLKCDVCGKYVFKSRFERHMRLRHYLPSNYVVECPICGVHVKYLPWHLHKFHKSLDYSKTMKPCRQCDQWFLTSEALESHLIDHEKYFCVDCFLHFDSHLKLAKHMYVVHKKVFNVGKTFKLGRSDWDKSCASAVTYHIEKHSEQKFDASGQQELLLRLGNTPPIHETSELLGTLEEESFTVILDEKGNLQNVILEKTRTKELTDGTQLNIDKPTFNLEQFPVREIEGRQDELKSVPMGKNKHDSKISTDSKVVHEYEVEIDKNTNTLQIIIPSEGLDKYRNFISEKDSMMKFMLAKEFNDLDQEFKKSLKENKLHERFVASKKFLPKSLNGVELSPEDEDVLQKAPKAEVITSYDLLKYQIGKREDVTTISNKFQACPSRQAHLCPYCRQVLKSRNSLSRHIAVVHLNERRFSCTQCEKSFATKADLAKHKKASHEETRHDLVECDICNEKFKSCYIKRHKYYKHPPNNLPKHCNECGKQFKTREIMLKHVKKIHCK